MTEVRVDELHEGDIISLNGAHAEIVTLHRYNLAQGDTVIGTSNTEDGNRWPVVHILAYRQPGIVRFPHETLHRIKEYETKPETTGTERTG